ncbi:MAG TPA: phenylalanine--tRNA ligase subunit beta [Armatimonadota bacterium]|jgi:phenylalanyl-tRNA synthetase beta chain
MRVPYSWLKEYLPGLPPVEELADVLTMGGLEVEEIRSWPDAAGPERVLMTKVTANRGDLLSLRGIARHAAALLRLDFAPAAFARELLGEPVVGERVASSGPVTVEIADPEGCPRYSALLLEGVTVGPPPDWLRQRLESAGMRSVNNVVDVTNYVCWELGQPLHAFDFPRLEQGQIRVRRAQPSEEFLLLDGSLPQLTAEDVLICDARGPVALAGIMGGADSEVRATTTRVLLEAAHFDATALRKTALRLGMSTEASYRFERFVDPNLTWPALARAAELILQLAGGAVAGPAVDVRTREFTPLQIDLRPERCNALLGTDLTPAQMGDYLRRMGCEVAEGQTLQVAVPTARWDVEREVDLIEEVAIIHGYNQLPTTLPGGLTQSGRLTRTQRLTRQAGEILRRCGLNETLSFSMMCPADVEKLGVAAEAPERRLLPLVNPMGTETSVMRTTLLPALLSAAAYNQRQRVRDLALYEINRVFLACGEGALPEEPQRVAGLVAGSPFTATWNLLLETAQVDFYWLKGLVEQLLAELGMEDVSVVRGAHPSFAPGACAQLLVGEQTLGYLGEIAAPVAQAYDLEGRLFAFELDFELILAQATLYRPYRPLPRFPAALRDVAVTVPDSDEFSAATLTEEIRTTAGEFVESVRPFDLYVSAERLGPGRKSLAFELVFRAAERTLTEEELEAAMTAVHQRLAALGGEIRTQ